MPTHDSLQSLSPEEQAALLERERQARLEAEAERARLENLIMEAPAFIALFRGPRHVYVLSNHRNTAALGHHALLGKPMGEVLPDAVTQGFVTLMDQVYSTGKPFSAEQMPLQVSRSDGSPSEHFVNFIYQPTRDANGHVDGIASFGFEVTALVRAREELKRAESHARFLSEASAVLASSLDYEATLRNVARLAVPSLADWCLVDLLQPDGSFKRVETVCTAPEDAELAQQVSGTVFTRDGNPRYPIIQAISEGRPVLIADISPQQIQEMALSEAHARQMAATRMRSVLSAPLVARGRTLGVLTFFMSHSGRRYTPAEFTVLEELARRAALSVENARLYKEAQDAIRLRDEFLSIASHELKTPLTPLSLKLQMLLREAKRQPDSPFRHAVEDYIAVGSRQVKKLSELVSDLLDVSRIVGGRLRLELEEVELRALVREVMARHEPEAARAGSTLVLKEASGPVTGRWDRLRLEQVITNLVDNAIKYGAGKPILVTLEAEEDRAVLRVKDEGIGIAPEHLKRIFERFERAVSERHYGGLGLGLYITRTIVEAMRGTIQVESTPGQGALFTVILPLRPPEPPPGPPAT